MRCLLCFAFAQLCKWGTASLIFTSVIILSLGEVSKQALASLPPYFCIDLYKGTLSFSFFVLFFCTEVSEMFFFNSVVSLQRLLKKNCLNVTCISPYYRFPVFPSPCCLPSQKWLSEHTFIAQTGFEPCGSHAEGRGCSVEMAWLLEVSVSYRQH